MSVDWITCSICGNNFPDCGPHGRCSGCGSALCEECHKEQFDKYGGPEEGSWGADNYGTWSAAKCDKCSGEIIYNDDIAVYLLEKLGITRDQVVEEIKQYRSKK